MNLADLNLLVRALHQDVSALDQRLREVETIIAELRQRQYASKVDLRASDARSA